MKAKLQSWRQDSLLRGVLRSSGHLFSGNVVMAGLGFLQGILIVRLLGMDGLGIVTTVTTLVSNINRFLSFRMGEVVVRHLGAALEQDNKVQASAVVRWSTAVEGSTSLLAFGALLLLAPWAARVLVKDSTSLPMFWLYGLVLLGNLIYETCVGVLQSLRHFDRLARINMLQSLLTFLLVVVAFGLRQGVWMVLLAYLAGKLLAGFGLLWLTLAALNKALGAGWWRAGSPQPGLGKKLFAFAFSTNINATVNLLVRDNIPLILGGLRSQIEVGYFKLALSLINLIMLPIEPFIWPTYAEINRTIAGRQWSNTRRLLSRVSLIAAAWTVSAGTGIAFLGPWLLPLVYGASAMPVYPAIMLLLVGYGFANIFNWNRPLLLALDQPIFPLLASALGGAAALAATFWLVPRFGYLMQAAILSAYFVASISVILWRGLSEIKRLARQDKLAAAEGIQV